MPDADGGGLVDWRATGRRLRRAALVLGAAAAAGWLLAGLLSGGPRLAALPGWLGLGLGGLFVAEVVIVGGSALRAMLRAGEQGERLVGGDVGLLPPQVGRRGGPPAGRSGPPVGPRGERLPGRRGEPSTRRGRETGG